MHIHEPEDTSGMSVAERLFVAFRTIAPFKRRPGFGHGSRPGEFQLVHILAHESPQSGLRIGDLAAWLSVKPPTVTQLVNALESRNLVERYTDEEDRRAILVRLSPAGRELAASFRTHALEEAAALVEHLGEEDASRLADLLIRTANFLASRHGLVKPTGWSHHNHSGDE